MKLNLSKIKTIGFIPGFNSRKSYPEFGTVIVPKKQQVVNEVVKVVKIKTVSPNRLAVKKAKLTAKWQKNQKPYLLVSSKF